MSTNDPLKDWQLEGQGESPQQWKLQDAEQDLNKHMQLQPGDVGAQWQPVEYERGTKPRRRNWVLPSIVIVALLAVLGYVGWILVGQVGGGSGVGDVGGLLARFGVAPAAAPTDTQVAEEPATPTSAAPAPAATPVVAAAAPAETAQVEATATSAPAPTPTVALVDLITGTVNAVSGVNARKEPATTADVVTLLNQNEKLTVAKAENGWLQVILPDGLTVAWVSAEFVDQVSQPVPLDTLNAVLVAAGLPAIAAPPAASLTAAPLTSTGPGPEVPPVSLVVTVIGDPGINARQTPTLDGTVVRSVNLSTTLTAIGRTPDSAWVAVQLDDGTPAWVLANFVTIAGTIDTLSPLDPTVLLATTPLTETVAVSPTTSLPPAAAITATLPALVPNGVIPPAPFTNTLAALGPALTISDVTGVNVRAAPSTTAAALLVAPNGALLPVVGQSVDGKWLQVRLPDGQVGWMFADAVLASLDIAGAPVTEGAAVTTTVAVTPTVATPAGPTATATVVNELGANLRSAPTRDVDPVVTAKVGETFTAIGRTADGEWVQLVLADGANAWALAGTVSLDTDINTLSVTQP